MPLSPPRRRAAGAGALILLVAVAAVAWQISGSAWQTIGSVRRPGPVAAPSASLAAVAPPFAATPSPARAREVKPQMSVLLDLAADPANPDLFNVTVYARMEGAARLNVETKAPQGSQAPLALQTPPAAQVTPVPQALLTWQTPAPPGALTLRAGDAPRQFQFKIDRAKAAPGQFVRATLIFDDERGHPRLTYSRELTIGAPAAMSTSGATAASPSTAMTAPSRLQPPAFDAAGHAVQARVPADAPPPRVAEAGR